MLKACESMALIGIPSTRLESTPSLQAYPSILRGVQMTALLDLAE